MLRLLFKSSKFKHTKMPSIVITHSLSNSTAAVYMDNVIVSNRENLLFPWRKRIKKEYNLIDQVRSSASSFLLSIWILEGLSEMYVDVGLIRGARQAFIAAVNSIFHTVMLTDKKDELNNHNESEKDGSSLRYEKNDIPSLSLIFEERLAKFYQSAINFSNENNHKLNYKILDVGTPKIIKYEVLFGGKRGLDYKGLKQTYALGLFDSIVLDNEKGVRNFLKASKYVTIRVWVDIPCQEIFYLTSKSSIEKQRVEVGESDFKAADLGLKKDNANLNINYSEDESKSVIPLLIQGSNKVINNTHQLVLESYICTRDNEDKPKHPFEWIVIDIDDWLDGNDFWPFDARNSKPDLQG